MLQGNCPAWSVREGDYEKASERQSVAPAAAFKVCFSYEQQFCAVKPAEEVAPSSPAGCL